MKKKVSDLFSFAGKMGFVFVVFFMIFVMLILFIGAITTTSNMDNKEAEIVTFHNDFLLLNILFLIVTFLIGYFLIFYMKKYKLMEKIDVKKLPWFITIWVFIACVLWIVQSLSAPTHDSYIVSNAGVAAAQGDYSYIKSDYFVYYPFQLGYVLWTELWTRLFFLGQGAFIIMQFVNATSLAIANAAMVKLAHKFFGNKSITVSVSIMLALFVQPIIFITFLYGNIPGFAFSIWSVYFFVVFLQNGGYKNIVISSLLLSFAIVLKMNNMILLIAMCIVLLIKMMYEKSFKRVFALLILCAVVFGLKDIGRLQYEWRTGEDFGKGIPLVSWLAMGLNEASSAPGWYSHEYTLGNFISVNYDYDLASEESIKEVKERLLYFSENKSYTVDFFTKKTYSQWNETSFQSIWNNQVRGQYAEKFGIAKFVCQSGEQLTKRLMDINVQFIYCGILIALIFMMYDVIKKREIQCELLIIPLVILGAFIYHTLFEAKSQYLLTYVVMMIPYASWGSYRILALIRNISQKRVKK